MDTKETMVVYKVIKQDVQDIVEAVMEDVLNDPAIQHCLIRK